MGYIGQQPAKLALTSSDIADGVVGVADLGANSVDSSELVDNAVTLAKMASGTDGNIISADASGNPVAIATGNDGQVLTSTGAGSPPAFEAAAGGGKLLQIVSAETTSAISTTNDSAPQATGFTLAITPSATSSKILIMLSGGRRDQSDANLRMGLYLYYDVGGAGYNSVTGGADKIVTTSENTGDHSLNWLLSPSTTSAVTVQPYFIRDHGGSETIYFNSGGGRVQMQLLEIGA